MTIAISRSQSAFRRQESHLRKSRPRPPRLHPGSGGLGRPVSAERPRGLLKSSFDTVPTVRFHIQRHRRTRTGKPHTNTCPARTLIGLFKEHPDRNNRLLVYPPPPPPKKKAPPCLTTLLAPGVPQDRKPFVHQAHCEERPRVATYTQDVVSLLFLLLGRRVSSSAQAENVIKQSKD